MTDEYKKHNLGKDTKIPWLEGTLVQIPALDKFNFGYILYIPKNIGNNTSLIVEGSNQSSSTNSLAEGNKKILEEGLFPNLPIYDIANELGFPVLYPLFPRIHNGNETIYNHMLSSNCLSDTTSKIKEFGLERVDLQLIEMIKHAKEYLTNNGIIIDDKIIIDGFSASSKFANRFTILHPEIVKLCIAGGVSGVLTLPLKDINGEKLLWPNGVGNLKEIYKIDVSDEKLDAFKKVKQFYYMGDEDTQNDPFAILKNGTPMHSGIITQDEVSQMNSIYGNAMMQRWIKIQELYNFLGVNAEFKTYKGVGHDPRPSKNDVKNILIELCMDKEKTR